ncbi:iron hydrogenase small subunit [bacterium]|nr:iron hydrogenase small subunit [bacterium]
MTDMVKVTIDGKPFEVKKGITILEAAKIAGIRIPTLCHHPDLDVAGICRICVVEVEGMRTLQAACAYPITFPMDIKTNTSRVRKARRVNLDLMLAEHYGDCYTCVRNGKCELQSLSSEYGVDRYRYPSVIKPKYAIDYSSFSIVRDQNKCIHCKRCIRTCIDLQQVSALETANKGHDVEIQAALNKPIAEVVCINCGQCINRCPTGALRVKDAGDFIWDDIENPDKYVVIQTAPSPRAAIGEEFGYPAGTTVTKKLNAALKRMGFNAVLDTNFTADLTIIEEGHELLERLHKAVVEGDKSIKVPMFTSCSPGWVKYIEHYYPEYLGHLSSCKSPQQMFGALLKTYYAQKMGIDPEKMVVVALMPCSAKKFECNRPEMTDSGFKDVDYGLTTREMAVMIKESGIHLKDMPDEDFDSPIGHGSGAGMIFGATGGVMEAAIRTVYELVTGRKVPFDGLNVTPVRGMEGIKEASLLIENTVEAFRWLEGVTLKVAVAHGTANAKKLMEKLKKGELEYHFIEVMACPGGCLGGGGQPIPTTPEIREARARAIYAEDMGTEIRTSHENELVAQLYKDFLIKPLGHKSHKLLHTHYTPRGKYFIPDDK